MHWSQYTDADVSERLPQTLADVFRLPDNPAVEFNTLSGAVGYAGSRPDGCPVRIMGYGAYAKNPRTGGRADITGWAMPGYFRECGDEIEFRNREVFRDGGTHFLVECFSMEKFTGRPDSE